MSTLLSFDDSINYDWYQMVIPDLEGTRVDSDNDGLFDWNEYEYGSNPNDSDTDDDGYFDGWEVTNGYSPTYPMQKKINTYHSNYGDGHGRIDIKVWYEPEGIYKIKFYYGYSSYYEKVKNIDPGGSSFKSYTKTFSYVGTVYYRVKVYRTGGYYWTSTGILSFTITNNGNGGGTGPF